MRSIQKKSVSSPIATKKAKRVVKKAATRASGKRADPDEAVRGEHAGANPHGCIGDRLRVRGGEAEEPRLSGSRPKTAKKRGDSCDRDRSERRELHRPSPAGRGRHGHGVPGGAPVIGRKAALKLIHPQFAAKPAVVSRFITEAKAINQIGHEHIVDITDFGDDRRATSTSPWSTSRARALGDPIKRGPRFSPARALRICAQIADALQASHEHGVIHRDLKPDNIFLITARCDHDFVKVLDFGLAKLVNPSAEAPPPTTRRRLGPRNAVLHGAGAV